MKAKKLLKISGTVVLTLVILAVAVWNTLPLLPMTPQGEMTRAILVEMTRNEDQLAGQTAKSDTAYHHLQVMRQSFLPIAMQLTGPDPGVCEIAPLLPDIVRLSRACSRTDDLYSHYTKSENEWIATAPEVEPEVQAALVRDTEAFFRQAAEAADMRTQYAACAALVLRWMPALPRNEEQAAQMTQLVMSIEPAARPLINRYLDSRTGEDTISPMVRALPALRVLLREFLKNDTPRRQKLITELEQISTQALENLSKASDASSARTAAESLSALSTRRIRLQNLLAPVLFEQPESPELRQLDEIQSMIEKRIEELRKLPEPFYGCKELENLCTWG